MKLSNQSQGAILTGPPGTGKTLLAKATAGLLPSHSFAYVMNNINNNNNFIFFVIVSSKSVPFCS